MPQILKSLDLMVQMKVYGVTFCNLAAFDTEYDRAKVPLHNGNDPPPVPRSLKSPSVSTPIEQSRKQGDAMGASEVRRGTSSNHFHFPAPSRPVILGMEGPKNSSGGLKGREVPPRRASELPRSSTQPSPRLLGRP